MEIKITTKQILQALKVFSWIIFIGLCLEAGGILFNACYVLYKPIVAKYFWNGANLSDLYAYDKGHFITQVGLMFIVAVFKALIFYIILKLFYNKEVSIGKPFNPYVTGVIVKIGYLCLGAGVFSLWAVNYANWIKEKGIPMPDAEQLRVGGADVWLFMAVTLFVTGVVFKKGIEIQSENELTV